MNCNRFEKLIALYVEGDLSKRKNRRVEKHLNTCPACRQVTRELTRSQKVLRSLGHESIDSKVFESIQDRVLDQLVSANDRVNHTLWYPIPWSWRWTKTAVAGLFLLIGALAVWNIRSPRQTPFSLAERGKEIQTSPREELSGKAGAAQEVRDQQSISVPVRARRLRVGKGSKLSNPLPNTPPSSGEALVTAWSKPEDGRFEAIVRQLRLMESIPFENTHHQSTEGTIDQSSDTAKPGFLTIKLVTDDPEIVIVWLVDPDKGERQ
ncbi:MAG TPA: zf-HC2 domain-containing protein [Nitrososphaera sp.]|nr:zf-HC2 domain-containing protein [Nitrososphaera sp.]